MKSLKKIYGSVVGRVIDYATGNGLMQDEVIAKESGSVPKEISDVCRESAAESAVLLKNNGALPLPEGKPVAVFGRCQLDWFFVGYGSGGNVNAPYRVNLIEGLENGGIPFDKELAAVYKKWCESDEHKADHGWWGHWPFSHPEMPLDGKLAAKIAKNCETAIYVIGRAAGEERDNVLEPGSYYLTDEEKSVLSTITKFFRKVVVLINSGSIIDMSWTEEFGDRISAILYVWLGGMESGNAAADILSGKTSPSGRLADSIARSYSDYPSSKNFGNEKANIYAEDIFVGDRYFSTFCSEKVLYPFGYGLSYTKFSIEKTHLSAENGTFTFSAEIRNTGEHEGKETVLLRCSAPNGKLGKPEKFLCAFGKTSLLKPGESEEITLSFDKKSIASFDDTGVTGFGSAFVLEAGEYSFFMGNENRGSFFVPETELVEQCESALCVKTPFERIHCAEKDGEFFRHREKVEQGKTDLRKRVLKNLPPEVPFSGDKGFLLSDVACGKISLDEFVTQLSEKELEALCRGEGGMGSSLGTPGNAGAIGGILPSLREKGVSPIITADGPAGLRLCRVSALIPCGTAIACTFDEKLTERLFEGIASEMDRNRIDIILSPGMNIHRNPLCGRNFEYFSEDPLLTGKIAAAAVRGIQSRGKSACPKHFAANSQEKKRNVNDSVVSERALREIYLRGFEICVKEGKPKSVMTSYNKINGVWSHYNYDLVTTVLRKEWGYSGAVMTDWWMRKSKSPEFPNIRDNAYRVRAQVDILMPGNMDHVIKSYHSDGTLLSTLGKKDGITRGEILRSAKNTLRLVIDVKKNDLSE